jgi:hypothetical protein
MFSPKRERIRQVMIHCRRWRAAWFAPGRRDLLIGWSSALGAAK